MVIVQVNSGASSSMVVLIAGHRHSWIVVPLIISNLVFGFTSSKYALYSFVVAVTKENHR
jgi:hypothetical protein